MLRRAPLYCLILSISLLCVLSLSGCDFLAEIFRFGKDAGAQDNGRQVRTFKIQPESFRLEPDSPDDLRIEVVNGATIYTQLSGEVAFTLASGTSQPGVTPPIELLTEDVIIERPETGFVTILFTPR
jgi:hypothetical protein